MTSEESIYLSKGRRQTTLVVNADLLQKKRQMYVVRTLQINNTLTICYYY